MQLVQVVSTLFVFIYDFKGQPPLQIPKKGQFLFFNSSKDLSLKRILLLRSCHAVISETSFILPKLNSLHT